MSGRDGLPVADELANGSRMRRQPHLVSVIVPTTAGGDLLELQLQALSRQTYRGRWEVVVASNGSSPLGKVVGRGKRLLPSLRLVDASDRRGASYARNVGIECAAGDLLVFCDDDDIVDEGWLEALVRSATTSDAVGGVLETRALNDSRIREDRRPPSDRLQSAADFLPFASSNNMAVWRDVLEEVGVWDERYVTAHDKELSWRLQLYGYRLSFAPDAVVHYRFRANLRGRLRQVWRYTFDDVRLYRDFRHLGARRRSLVIALKAWGWIAIHALDLVGGSIRRRLWLSLVLRNAAMVAASLRYRVFHP